MALLVLLGILGAAGAATAALNVPEDSDGDGLLDRIDCGDFDADGTLETADVQACLDALDDDPDGLDLHVAVAGDYVSPSSAGFAAYPTGNTLAAVELRSHTRLRCAAGVTLQGWPATLADPVNPSTGPKVVYVVGADDVEIRDCKIDAMMPTVSTDCTTLALGCSSKGRIGVHVEDTTNFRVEDLHVVNTQHACIYVARGRDGVIRNNLLENCGGYYLANMESFFPGIYLYSRQGTSTERLVIEHNTVRKHGAAAYTTRNNEYQAGRIVDVLWEDNYAEDGASCLILRGARRHTVRRNTCVRNDGIIVHHKATGFCSVVDDHECVEDVEILDNVVLDVSSNHAYQVYDYAEGVTLEGNYARGTPYSRACLRIQQPGIGVTLRDNEFHDCGGAGIQVEGDAVDPAHSMVWEDNLVEGTGLAVPTAPYDDRFSGVRIEGEVTGLDVDGLVVRGPAAHGIDVTPGGRLTNTSWRSVYIEGLEGGFLGGSTEVDAPVCEPTAAGAWIETTSASGASDCAFGSSVPFKYNRCRCVGGGSGALGPGDVPTPQGLRLGPPPGWGAGDVAGGSVVVRPGAPDQETCAIAWHTADEVGCVAPWNLVPSVGEAFVIYDWSELDNQSAQRFGLAVRSDRASNGNLFEGFTLKNFLGQHAIEWSNEAHDANRFDDVLAVFDAPQQGLANQRPMDGAIQLRAAMTGTTAGPVTCIDTDPSELCFDPGGAAVTYLPEPAGSAALLSGCALLGALGRRRRA